MFSLYADENLQDGRLLLRLRAQGVDCLTSNEAGNGAKTDEEQLVFATNAGRSILTFDRGDFQRLHAKWMQAGRDHAGIVVVSRGWVSTNVIHAHLMRLQAERTPEDMRNAILFIGRPAPPA